MADLLERYPHSYYALNSSLILSCDGQNHKFNDHNDSESASATQADVALPVHLLRAVLTHRILQEPPTHLCC